MLERADVNGELSGEGGIAYEADPHCADLAATRDLNLRVDLHTLGAFAIRFMQFVQAEHRQISEDQEYLPWAPRL